MGVSAKTVARAVIRMGRRRCRAPWVMASATFIPGWPFRGCRYWLMRSIRTMALVTTMPTSMSMPISDGRPSGTPVASSRATAPVAANGTDTSRMSGWMSDLKAATMITYTMAIAASSAMPSCWNDSVCCVVAPPISAVTPAGSSTP